MRRFVLVACCLAGCVANDDTGVAQQAIVGGTMTSDDPAVVMVVAQEPTSSFATVCTGSIVSPHVVLTAAHCVDPINVGSTAVFSLYFGTDALTAQSSDFMPVASTAFDPKYSSKDFSAGSDLGVVISPTPLTQTPLALNRKALSSSLMGQAATLLGYGETGPDLGATAGIKREVMATLESYTSDFVRFGMEGATACEGDSGGPALMTIDGAQVLVGAVSFGDENCAAAVTYSRVDAYLDWLDPQIEAADPGFLTDLSTPKHGGCSMASAPSRAPWIALVMIAALVLTYSTVRSRLRRRG